MELFHVIDDGVVHLRSKGVYRQTKVFRRGADVFAAYGGGVYPPAGRPRDHAPGCELGRHGRPWGSPGEQLQAYVPGRLRCG